jgi:hypothetical protein
VALLTSGATYKRKDMKLPIYLRIAKSGKSRNSLKGAAATKPNNTPLNSCSYHTEWYPTVSFGVVLEIPDDLFGQESRLIGELNISMKDAIVSSEFVVPNGITIKPTQEAS